jgi:hypothetical protein
MALVVDVDREDDRQNKPSEGSPLHDRYQAPATTAHFECGGRNLSNRTPGPAPFNPSGVSFISTSWPNRLYPDAVIPKKFDASFFKRGADAAHVIHREQSPFFLKVPDCGHVQIGTLGSSPCDHSSNPRAARLWAAAGRLRYKSFHATERAV